MGREKVWLGDRGVEQRFAGVIRDSRGLKGRPKLVRGEKGREVLKELVWGHLKFPQETIEIPYYPPRKEAARIGRAHSQQEFEKGVFGRLRSSYVLN